VQIVSNVSLLIDAPRPQYRSALAVKFAAAVTP
jgi:hypothetical protein